MRNTHLYLFLFAIVFIACNDRNRDVRIFIDLETSKSGSYSDLFSGLDYILLSNTEDQFLISPSKIVFSKERIYVSDIDQNILFIYDKKGNVIETLDSEGEGPFEFKTIDDFQIYKDTLIIKDGFLKKWIKFNLDGKVISEEKNIFLRGKFFKQESFTQYYLNNDSDLVGDRVIRIGNDGSVSGFIPIPENLEKRLYQNHVGFLKIRDSERFLFNLPFTYEIAFFNSNGFLDQLKQYDFGKYNFKNDLRFSFSNLVEEFEYLAENRLVYEIGNYLPVSKNLFLMYVKQENGGGHFILMDEKDTIIYQGRNLENNIDGLPLDLMPWTVNDSSVVFRTNSNFIYDNYKKKFKLDKNLIGVKESNLHELVYDNQDIMENDNHVLILAKFKE
ncbi:6-bladed beta-propeller [Cyclobacterium xiamenense]|uniref:6-bladed beta-propeller n=1 Tax=Cyclobacterium xiamenense TaxID=1297121 RepID=UPI0012B973BB|nr:6-bladed beta-propeller [Cyclobacterium xiamenense]